jgi:hypothetical protein
VLVTLAQRSNVETLLIAFVAVLALYLLVTTAPSTAGSAAILVLRGLGHERGQRLMQRRIDRTEREDKRAYLNVIVKAPGGGTLDLPIEDEFGRIGELRLDGGEVGLIGVPGTLSISPVRLAVTLLDEQGDLDGTDCPPKIVFWASVGEGPSEAYGSQVRAFKRLEAALGKPLWPAVSIGEEEVERLRQMLRQAAPHLREDCLLPDIEYETEFTIPIIPEPLALVQLRRSQQHSDAVASMGCATLVMLAILATLCGLLLWPPWVPGK